MSGTRERASRPAAAPGPQGAAAAARGRPARHGAGRPRRDRPQHGRPRVRRPAAGHRLRRPLPRGRAARRRPDPARLRRHRAPPRRHRPPSSSPTATRTTSARSRTCCGCASDIPLVGSRFTLALVAAKLREHRIDPVLVEVAAGDDHLAGPFHCEFISVNHSIPDALAVAVHTPAGLLVHTGDFKMDQLPLDGVLTDLGAFARLGVAGIDLLLSDSTNAEVPGFVTPERSIGPVLDDVFARATQRLIVSSFASHVHRIQQVLDCAATHGRKVALVGRSMVRNMGVARDLGLLHVAPGPDGLARRGRRDAARAGGAGLHRVAGRAAVGAGPDGARRAPPGHHRGRRHRRPRLVAGARQRDRRLQGDQRPGPARRHRRAQGDRPGARLRARARPASCARCSTWPSRAT